ncbi:hypothetical protein NS226_01565 [Aureimonas ureilytica]|uniref:Uncharacterized protein n=1 Tax=Aureimonas ureilytica TaxID=401562 RepID=A0A175RDQ6_9HYPH|nr:hypothetical protein NS226_01565 [Aureimonas ureilytica]
MLPATRLEVVSRLVEMLISAMWRDEVGSTAKSALEAELRIESPVAPGMKSSGRPALMVAPVEPAAVKTKLMSHLD